MFLSCSWNEICGVQRVHVGVSDCETDKEKDRMHETNTNADEMQMLTWDEMHDMNKMENEDKNPTTKAISYHTAGNGKSWSYK